MTIAQHRKLKVGDKVRISKHFSPHYMPILGVTPYRKQPVVYFRGVRSVKRIAKDGDIQLRTGAFSSGMYYLRQQLMLVREEAPDATI